MDSHYDYIIVGAGPAGLQMAYFMQKAGRRYVVLERNSTACSFYHTFPRHRTLISINKKYNHFTESEFNMRHDWNSLISDDPDLLFTNYTDDLFPSADHITQYMADFAAKTKLNIMYNTSVARISKQDGVFTVRTGGEDSKTLTAKAVVMATGAIKEHLPSSIKGIEHAETYSSHSTDRTKYSNKRVCVIGGGNSGFETADHLAGNASILHLFFGNKELKMAWNTHYVGDLRAVNNKIIDMYHLKSMHSTIGSRVVEVEPLPNGNKMVHVVDLVTHWPQPGWLKYSIEYEHVIACTGWTYVDSDLFDDDIHPETMRNGRYPVLSESWETKTPGLFYIGAAMAGDDTRSASGFIHGFRYNVQSLFHIMEQRYSSVSFPSVTLKCDLQDVATMVIDRTSINDAMYQMNALICDVMSVRDGKVQYYTSVPRKFLNNHWKLFGGNLYVVYLDYGFEKFPVEPLQITHAPDFTNNKCVPFLHPFMDRVIQGEITDQLELMESLVMRYDQKSEIFPQWKENTNFNYVKDFINRNEHWSSGSFDLAPIPQEVAQQIFTPLTDEELSRLPPMPAIGEGQCKAGVGGLRSAVEMANQKSEMSQKVEQKMMMSAQQKMMMSPQLMNEVRKRVSRRLSSSSCAQVSDKRNVSVSKSVTLIRRTSVIEELVDKMSSAAVFSH